MYAKPKLLLMGRFSVAAIQAALNTDFGVAFCNRLFELTICIADVAKLAKFLPISSCIFRFAASLSKNCLIAIAFVFAGCVIFNFLRVY